MKSEEIREALRAVEPPVPGSVARYDVRVGRDHMDEPAVWVYVILNDDRSELTFAQEDELVARIREALKDLLEPNAYVYPRFRLLSEVEPQHATGT